MAALSIFASFLRFGWYAGLSCRATPGPPVRLMRDTMQASEPPAPGEEFDLPDFPPRTSIPYLTLYPSRRRTADYLARIPGTGIAPAKAFVLPELGPTEPLSQVEISQR